MTFYVLLDICPLRVNLSTLVMTVMGGSCLFFRSFAYFCLETPEGTKIMASPRLVFAVGSIIPIVPMESAACRPVYAHVRSSNADQQRSVLPSVRPSMCLSVCLSGRVRTDLIADESGGGRCSDARAGQVDKQTRSCRALGVRSHVSLCSCVVVISAHWTLAVPRTPTSFDDRSFAVDVIKQTDLDHAALCWWAKNNNNKQICNFV